MAERLIRWTTYGAAVLLVATAYPARAQTPDVYPMKPLRIVVGFAPGGGADGMARAASDELAKELGQPVIVDNRPGAFGIVGADTVAKAAPDGHVLLMADRSVMVYNAGLLANLPYNPASDFVPVGLMLRAYYVLVAAPRSGIGDLKTLLARAKAQPGSLNYASPSTGSALVTELLRQRTGMDIVRVPYKGAAQAITDLLSGQVQLMMADTLVAAPHIRAGRLKALGVTSRNRVRALPDIPAIGEEDVANFEGGTWFGLFSPAGTANWIVARLNRALNAAVRTPRVSQRIEAVGFDPDTSTPEQFAQLLREDLAFWPDQIRRWGVKLDQ